MARFEDRALTCPHCQHVAVRSVAVSLDAEHGKPQLQEILDGTFQRFACERCGKSYRADGPLVYLDFDDQRWVGVFPEPEERRWCARGRPASRSARCSGWRRCARR